jgi:hypothetical protein
MQLYGKRRSVRHSLQPANCKSGYSFPAGSQFALAAKAGTVSAWTTTGSEYMQVLTAADSTFISGYTGIEGSGNITRLKDFRSGPLPPF